MIVILAMALSPALLLAQKVSYDFSKSANFAAFKTYAQKDGTKVGQPLIDERLAAAVVSRVSATSRPLPARSRRRLTVAVSVVVAVLLAGTAYGAGRAYRHLGDESASSSPTRSGEPASESTPTTSPSTAPSDTPSPVEPVAPPKPAAVPMAGSSTSYL